MRTVIFISTILLFISCSDKIPDEKESQKTTFYYIIDSDRSRPHDTIHRTQILAPDIADALVAKGGFVYQQKNHGISVYTSDNHSQIDGGRLYYTLDTFGIIFERSTTWRNSVRLKSNNDSINDIISHALAHILSRPDLHAYQCRRYDNSPEVIKVNK